MNRAIIHKATTVARKYAPQILSVVAVGGMVATAVSAVKETPKVQEVLAQKEKEAGEPLEWFEKVYYAAPHYKKTLIFGVGTAACILGAQFLNQKKQAALVSTCKLLEEAYNDYRVKVKEIGGDDVYNQVEEAVAKSIYDQDYDIIGDHDSLANPECERARLFYIDDGYNRKWIETDPVRIMNGEYEVNRKLHSNGGVYLNDFNRAIGLPEIPAGWDLGWSSYEIQSTYSKEWIEFDHLEIMLEDGLTGIIVTPLVPPTYDFSAY